MKVEGQDCDYEMSVVQAVRQEAVCRKKYGRVRKSDILCNILFGLMILDAYI